MKKRVEKKRKNRVEKLVRVAMNCARGLHNWYLHPWFRSQT